MATTVKPKSTKAKKSTSNVKSKPKVKVDPKNKKVIAKNSSVSKKPLNKLFISVYLKNFWVFGYILFFIALSQLTLRYDIVIGVYMNGLAIIALLGLAMIKPQTRKLALSANILPVATLISLVLPNMSNYSKTVVFYDSILILGLIYRYMFIYDGSDDRARLKLKNYAILIPLMIIAGQILGIIGYGLLRHHYPFFGVSLPLIIATAVVFAFTEETFFRGLIQSKGNQLFHPQLSAVLAVLVFVLATITHATMIAPLFALILGSALSLTYYFRQNLVLTGIMNLTTKLVYLGLIAAFRIK